MNSPDDNHIKKMVAELDEAVPRDGARIHLSQYGGGTTENKIVGNQRGYLRLGIEFLRAAFAPESTKSPRQIDVDLSDLLTEDSTVNFDWFERRDDLATDSLAEREPSMFVPAVITLALVCGVILAIIGFVTIVLWIL